MRSRKRRNWRQRLALLTDEAEKNRGNTAGDLARSKIIEIINAHPEAAKEPCVMALVKKDTEISDAAIRIAAFNLAVGKPRVH